MGPELFPSVLLLAETWSRPWLPGPALTDPHGQTSLLPVSEELEALLAP